MLTVPLLAIGPPVSPWPVLIVVTVPLPVPVAGKVCPAANVTRPLLAIETPVSPGAFPSEKKRRFNEPEGLVVLLPTGSAFHWKSWFTAELLKLLKDEAS